MGRTDVRGAARPFLQLTERSGEPTDEPDGLVSEDGLIVGTYVHGLFENDDLRRGLLDWLARRPAGSGVDRSTEATPPVGTRVARQAQFDALADVVRAALDVDALKRACGLI